MAGFQPNTFNTQLCDCFDDCPSCLDGTFCPYCQVSSQYNMIAYQKREVYLPLCLGLFCLDVLTGGAGITGGAICMRSTMVQRYMMTDETPLATCCIGFWCPGCSICQVYREMSIRHEWPGGICVDKPFQHPLGICAPEIPGMGALPVSGVVLSGGAYAQGGGAGGMPPYNSIYAGSGGGGGYGQPPAAQQQQQYPPAQPYYYGNANPQYGQTQATAPPPPPPQQPAAKHEPYVSNAHQRV